MCKNEELRDRIVAAVSRMKSAHLNMILGGVSHKEFFTLEILARFMEEYPEKEGMCVSELAMSIHASMPQTSRLLKSMEEKKYIKRFVNGQDRRNTYVEITDVGRLERKCVKDEMDKYINTVIGKMGEEKINQLIELINESVEIMKNENSRRKENMK